MNLVSPCSYITGTLQGSPGERHVCGASKHQHIPQPHSTNAATQQVFSRGKKLHLQCYPEFCRFTAAGHSAVATCQVPVNLPCRVSSDLDQPHRDPLHPSWMCQQHLNGHNLLLPAAWVGKDMATTPEACCSSCLPATNPCCGLSR